MPPAGSPLRSHPNAYGEAEGRFRPKLNTDLALKNIKGNIQRYFLHGPVSRKLFLTERSLPSHRLR